MGDWSLRAGLGAVGSFSKEELTIGRKACAFGVP